MVDVGSAYLEVKERFGQLVGSLSDHELQQPVRACPGWTVQDVVAHHVGAISDVAAGQLPEIGDPSRLLEQWRDPEVARDRDAMTARHVTDRRGRSVRELLQEWDDDAAVLAPALTGDRPMPGDLSPMIAAIAVNDVVVHEGDVREALGIGAAPEVLATSLALAGYGASFDLRLRKVGLPALAFAYDGKVRQFGEGEPAATVSADRTTLVRLLASRLGEEQIRELDWSGDATPYLAVLPEYGPARPATGTLR